MMRSCSLYSANKSHNVWEVSLSDTYTNLFWNYWIYTPCTHCWLLTYRPFLRHFTGKWNQKLRWIRTISSVQTSLTSINFWCVVVRSAPVDFYTHTHMLYVYYWQLEPPSSSCQWYHPSTSTVGLWGALMVQSVDKYLDKYFAWGHLCGFL